MKRPSVVSLHKLTLTVAFKPALAVDLNGCKHKLAPAPQDDFYSRNPKLTSTVVTLSPLWWQNYSFFLVFLSFLVFRSAFRFPALYFGFYLSLKYSSTTLVTFWSQVRSTRQSKVDYFSRILKSALRSAKSATLVASQSLLCAASKVDFGRTKVRFDGI
jgi:hypothetical protein